MDVNCYELLLRHCPDTVVHLAIRAVVQSSWCWDDVRDIIVHAKKMNALSVEDVESGLLPFMMVGEGCVDLMGLSMVYELLCLNPGVLKENDVYCCSKMKRTSDGSTDSRNDRDAKRSRLIVPP